MERHPRRRRREGVRHLGPRLDAHQGVLHAPVPHVRAPGERHQHQRHVPRCRRGGAQGERLHVLRRLVDLGRLPQVLRGGVHRPGHLPGHGAVGRPALRRRAHRGQEPGQPHALGADRALGALGRGDRRRAVQGLQELRPARRGLPGPEVVRRLLHGHAVAAGLRRGRPRDDRPARLRPVGAVRHRRRARQGRGRREAAHPVDDGHRQPREVRRLDGRRRHQGGRAHPARLGRRLAERGLREVRGGQALPGHALAVPLVRRL